MAGFDCRVAHLLPDGDQLLPHRSPPTPGRQPLTEQVFYHLLFNFLAALTQTGVAVCGAGAVEPLAGRTESVGTRN